LHQNHIAQPTPSTGPQVFAGLVLIENDNWRWTRKVKAKTVTVALSDKQA
jgi:hypothetical protein